MGKISRGTNCGIIDLRAGEPSTVTAASTTSNAYITPIGPFFHDNTANPNDVNVVAAILNIITVRRLYRSAKYPAGSAKIIVGKAIANPTNPNASACPVRAYISHPIAAP